MAVPLQMRHSIHWSMAKPVFVSFGSSLSLMFIVAEACRPSAVTELIAGMVTIHCSRRPSVVVCDMTEDRSIMNQMSAGVVRLEFM